MTKNRFNSRSIKVSPLWLLAITLSLGMFIAVLSLNTGPETAVFAESDDMQKARETYPQIVNTRLDHCDLCHTGTKWNLNEYGRDYKQQGSDLMAIYDWDSDGDGFNNIDEINALTFPGDASDVPQPDPTPNPEPTAKPHTNLAITKHVDKATPLPGETISFMLTISNLGSVTATDIVVVDIIPATILAPAWTHSISLDGIIALAGEDFSWDLPDMPPGAEGIIIVSGQLNPEALSGSAVVNKAAVSSSGEDSDENDNEDEVLIFVGGHQLYLPVIMQN